MHLSGVSGEKDAVTADLRPLLLAWAEAVADGHFRRAAPNCFLSYKASGRG